MTATIDDYEAWCLSYVDRDGNTPRLNSKTAPKLRAWLASKYAALIFFDVGVIQAIAAIEIYEESYVAT